MRISDWSSDVCSSDLAGAIFNAYAEAGGNFIDTADVYQFGQSETILGELLQGRREDFVPATKFTRGDGPNAWPLVTGNNRKAIVASAEASLKSLKTDRHAIYCEHFPDHAPHIKDALPSLADLPRASTTSLNTLSNSP